MDMIIGYFDSSKYGTPQELVFAPSAIFRGNIVYGFSLYLCQMSSAPSGPIFGRSFPERKIECFVFLVVT